MNQLISTLKIRMSILKNFIPLFLVIIASSTLTNCAAYQSMVRQSEIRKHKTYIARNARYNQKYQEIYSAVYSVISGKYNIARESESRGFIETEWERASSSLSQSRKRVTAEIIGRESPYRMTMRVTRRSRSKRTDGWSPWTTKRDIRTENRLLIEIYELLNGKIDIPTELQKKG